MFIYNFVIPNYFPQNPYNIYSLKKIMLDKLGSAIKGATDKIANAIFLDKNLVKSIIRDLQRALLEADVNIMLIKELSDKIKKAALDERIKEIEKKEHVIKLLHDELVKILGEKRELVLGKGQNRLVLLGLYGAGKTTHASKLANYYAKRGKKVAIVGLDVHRPAAKEQLLQLGRENGLNVFVDLESDDPIATWEKFKPKLKDYDLVIVDTAGRHNLDSELIEEIEAIGKAVKPTETVLVIPADIGQTAKAQASEFQKALSISGVIISRMDSSAKAGGALSACAETNASVYFIGTGEKVNDLELFNPETFLSRLLGMGDLSSLLEKIHSVTDEGKMEDMQERIMEGNLTLNDVVEQVKSMSSLGGFDKIKGMIPGMGKAKISDDAMEGQQKKVEKWEHILKSMTEDERENPELLKEQTKRIGRIAAGSGVNNSDVRSLLKQYDMLKDMVKMSSSMDMSKGMDPKQMQKMMRKFGKKGMKF